MSSKNKTHPGKNEYHSISKKLKKELKSNENFEIMLNRLTLEEIIGLKLELACRSVKNNKLYGIPIWSSLNNITKVAVLRFALSTTKTQHEAARFLGLKYNSFLRYLKDYNVNSYFMKKDSSKIKTEIEDEL